MNSNFTNSSQMTLLLRHHGNRVWSVYLDKGMWWRTYYRLQERAYKAEQRSDAGFMVMARRFVKVW